MRKTFFYLIMVGLISSLVFAGCKKNNGETDMPDNPDNPNNPAAKLVSCLYDGYVNRHYIYEYDAQNRLSKVKIWEIWDMNGDGIIDDTNELAICSVTYPFAKTICYDEGDYNFTFTLNSEGTVIKGVDAYSVYMYEYENGYLKTQASMSAMDTIQNHYFWNNEKIDSVVQKSQNGSTKYTYTYTTIPYKECSIASWKLPASSIGRFYHYHPNVFGKSTSYLLLSETNESQSLSEIINYSYEMDADGYVTKMYAEGGRYGGIKRLLFEVKYK
jgi:hypothetical protein